ncbi:MAG: hypothetical protein F6K19_51045 [Cyanothece sp. SIO1E1]|nr:hypothetical protein [Cyanothece sp. SIO1E1]
MFFEIEYVLSWLPMVPIAIGNALLRKKLYGPGISSVRAHQISTLSLIVFITVYVWLIFLVWPLESSGQAWLFGVWWMMLTVVFEFAFGRFVVGYSWSKLFSEYNLLAGNIWILIPIWVATVPILIFEISNYIG